MIIKYKEICIFFYRIFAINLCICAVLIIHINIWIIQESYDLDFVTIVFNIFNFIYKIKIHVFFYDTFRLQFALCYF